ncbi:hypothetical protein SAMD00019534_013000 [Acytostelium subglobosum LB1]|uniref:hypothetical protein n=1 Tax=Acytostelium subglobosum LB1 TaxID=1410327 RepID=UPI000644F90A|nr:hypothetical protein SAMD00019534_013000 [Acytostelium subglobosum LB1]GAM18125.1 hypothetical protein SAMD00019534_013000 [Acytostelium subglobosum LB1]|eukprot:XP_012758721.1 hypothetical protein SAMD00019534_013000 [Acytostelium subglobosum LB1]
MVSSDVLILVVEVVGWVAQQTMVWSLEVRLEAVEVVVAVAELVVEAGAGQSLMALFCVLVEVEVLMVVSLVMARILEVMVCSVLLMSVVVLWR